MRRSARQLTWQSCATWLKSGHRIFLFSAKSFFSLAHIPPTCYLHSVTVTTASHPTSRSLQQGRSPTIGLPAQLLALPLLKPSLCWPLLVPLFFCLNPCSALFSCHRSTLFSNPCSALVLHPRSVLCPNLVLPFCVPLLCSLKPSLGPLLVPLLGAFLVLVSSLCAF